MAPLKSKIFVLTVLDKFHGMFKSRRDEIIVEMLKRNIPKTPKG